MPEQLQNEEDSANECTGDPIDFNDVDESSDDEERQESLSPQVSDAEARSMIEDSLLHVNFAGEDTTARYEVKTKIMDEVNEHQFTRIELHDFIEKINVAMGENLKHSHISVNPDLIDDVIEPLAGLITEGDSKYFDTYVKKEVIIDLLPALAQQIVDKRP